MAINEGLVLNGLDLNNGTTRFLTALTLPIPRRRPEWIEGADADGALLMRDPLVSNGQLVATVDLYGSSKDNGLMLIGEIVDQLEEADRNPGGIPLVWTPADGTKTLTFYVLTGEITELPQDMKWVKGKVASATMTLDCRPGGYGAEVTGPSATVTGPVATLDVPDVLGDMPSDEARLVITEMSSQSRRHVEWGMEQRYYNPGAPWPVILDSDSLVTSGFSGTHSTRAGAYDPNASGNNIITSSVFTTPQAICGTGVQPHIGTFRVKARVYSPGAVDEFGSYVRLAWRVGDGSYTTNAPTFVSLQPAFTEIDLGLISIPQAVSGTQSWDGRIEAWSNSTIGEVLEVDYLLLIPAGEGYGKARAEYILQPGFLVARDEFTGMVVGAALNGRVAPTGGTWATSGAAGDFVGSAGFPLAAFPMPDTVRRTATGVRYGILGATNYTDCAISAWAHTGTFANNAEYAGVTVRWVNATNYLAFRYSLASIVVEAVIAGVATTLASIPTAGTGGSAIQRLVLAASAAGDYIAILYDAASGTLLRQFEGTHSALATGGVLATGKPGIVDNGSSTGGGPYAHDYDNISVSQLPTAPIALYAGRTLEVQSATTIRQSSTGTTYGTPGSYRGSRFVLQPAGSADRTTRIVATAHRNDVEVAEAANITDQIKIQPFYRPRYSTVPR